MPQSSTNFVAHPIVAHLIGGGCCSRSPFAQPVLVGSDGTGNDSAIPATSSGDGMKPHRQISPLSLYRYAPQPGHLAQHGQNGRRHRLQDSGRPSRLRPQLGHRPQAGQPLRYVSASMIIPQQGVSMKAMGRSPRIAGVTCDGHRPWVCRDPVPRSRTDARIPPDPQESPAAYPCMTADPYETPGRPQNTPPDDLS